MSATDEPKLGETLDAVNEAYVAGMVKAGTMPPSVLDHLGHVKHGIYNPACEFCAPARSSDSAVQ